MLFGLLVSSIGYLVAEETPCLNASNATDCESDPLFPDFSTLEPEYEVLDYTNNVIFDATLPVKLLSNNTDNLFIFGTDLPVFSAIVTCSQGQYTLSVESVDAPICLNCPAGTYSQSTTATECLSCPDGKYSLDTASACESCAYGMYPPSSSTSACSYCLPGEYTTEYPTPTCTSCPAGTFRLMRSAPVATVPAYASWLPIEFTWSGETWTFTGRYYQVYPDKHQYPVYYSATGWNGLQQGCAFWMTTSWAFMYHTGSVGVNGANCAVGLSGYKAGFWGSDVSLKAILLQSTNVVWCAACPAGKYSLPSATVCISCPPGTHGSFTAERRYPPKKFTSASVTSAITVLGQSVFMQDVTLDTAGIAYGSGTYSLYKSNGQNTYVPSQLVDFTSNSAYWGGSYSSTGAFVGTARYIISGYYGDWAMMRLPTPILLTRYIFKRWTDTSEIRMPGIWKCYGSNNGVNFEEIPGGSQDTRITSLTNGAYEKILVQLPAKTYTWYAWAVKQLYGDFTTMVIGEIEVYGKEPFSGGSCMSCGAGKYSTVVSALTPSVCIPCGECSTNGFFRSGCGGAAAGTCARCINT